MAEAASVAASEEHLGPQIETLLAQVARVRAEIGRVIHGQEETIDQTLIAILAGGHVLLVGMPGLGKSRLVETLGVVCLLYTSPSPRD